MCLNTSVCQTLAQTAEERSICKSVEINDTKMQQMLSRVFFFFLLQYKMQLQHLILFDCQIGFKIEMLTDFKN